MNTMNTKTLLVAVGLVLVAISLGVSEAQAIEVSAYHHPHFHWTSVRASGIGALESGSPQLKGYVAWAPTLQLAQYSLRATLGANFFTSSSAAQSPLPDFRLLLAMTAGNAFALELGPIAQVFRGNGMRFGAGVNGTYTLPETEWVRSIIIGYSSVIAPAGLTHEIQAGVGLDL